MLADYFFQFPYTTRTITLLNFIKLIHFYLYLKSKFKLGFGL